MTIGQRIAGFLQGVTKSFEPNQSISQWKPLTKAPKSSVKTLGHQMPGMIFPTLTTLANDFAMIDMYIQMNEGSSIKKVYNHPLLTSIKFPNDGMSKNKVLKLWLLCRAVYGEVVWFIRKGIGSTYEIFPVDPTSIQKIEFDEDGIPTEFVFHLKNGNLGKFLAEDIIYFSTPNLADFRRGFPAASVVIGKVDALAGAEEYNKNFFANDATPSLVVKLKNSAVSLAQKMGIKADWLSQFRGANNSHKIAVLDNDADVQTVGTVPKDLAFKELYTVTEDGIRANWNVNKTLLGMTENINRATLEGAEVNHAKHVIMPIFEEFVSELELKFLRKFYTKVQIIVKDINIKYESPVPDDVLTKAQIAQTGTAGDPFLSINEARELVGKPPQKGKEYDTVPVPLSLSVSNSSDKSVKKKSLTGKEVAKRHDRLVTLSERRVYIVMLQYYREQRKRVVENAQKSNKLNDVIDESFEIKELVRKMYPVFAVIARVSWAEKNNMYGTDESYPETELTTKILWYVTNFSKEIVSNTVFAISDILSGRKSIVSKSENSEKIDQYYEMNAQNRAKSTSETETNGIIGTVLLYLFLSLGKKGLAHRRKWITVGDLKVRHAHAEAEGQIIELPGKYTVGGELLEYPGDPRASAENRIYCRCTEDLVD